MDEILSFEGTIERKTDKFTSDNREYFTLKFREADTIFTCFSSALGRPWNEGDRVKVFYTTVTKDDRTYYNIEKAERMMIAPQSTLKPEIRKEISTIDPKETMRQCFKDAKEIFSSEFGEAGVEEVTKVALSLFIQKMKR